MQKKEGKGWKFRLKKARTDRETLRKLKGSP
jgi:hypothetical protein